MDNCIFCKIINKEIPANIVYENSSFLAFLDINPVSDGHLLVIPKEHTVWMQEAEDQMIAKIFTLVKKLMIVLKKGVRCDYVQISVGGTDVPHLHIHLIPRMLDDGLKPFPTKKYRAGEAVEIEKRIASLIPLAE